MCWKLISDRHSVKLLLILILRSSFVCETNKKQGLTAPGLGTGRPHSNIALMDSRWNTQMLTANHYNLCFLYKFRRDVNQRLKKQKWIWKLTENTTEQFCSKHFRKLTDLRGPFGERLKFCIHHNIMDVEIDIEDKNIKSGFKLNPSLLSWSNFDKNISIKLEFRKSRWPRQNYPYPNTTLGLK